MVRRITEPEFEDRMEWLSGAAGQELQQANRDWLVGYGAGVCDVLDRIKQAAAECAVVLREGPKEPK